MRFFIVRADVELVNSCLNGEKAAFEVLVRRYERSVKASAMAVMGNRGMELDAAQEAFIKAYKKLPLLRKKEVFGPWLLKITRRCAMDIASQRTKQKPFDTALDYPAESKDSELDEEKQQLLAAVMKLPKSEQQVVMLKYFSSHSVKEVAEILGRSVGTVTKQLSRAHRRLRKLLREHENE
jgi:RNA polymerase sigma-70 factor (ECF subfamily)